MIQINISSNSYIQFYVYARPTVKNKRPQIALRSTLESIYKSFQLETYASTFAGTMQQMIQVKYVNIFKFTPYYPIAVQRLLRNKRVATLQVASKQKSITIKSEETLWRSQAVTNEVIRRKGSLTLIILADGPQSSSKKCTVPNF